MPHADDDIIIDFLHDWAETQRARLISQGYKPSADDQTVSFQYFNLEKRRVEARPRRVHEASDLVCPPDLQPAYEAVKQKIARGDELRPHLSRKLTDLDFDDMLVNDWGIYHLHLTTSVEGDGFVKRTGPVLFVRFEDEDAYLITIQGHGRGAPNAFANQGMLKTIRDNWPSVMDRHVAQGVSRVERRVTDDELRLARKKGVMVLIQLGDVVVFPMGGGYSTTGISSEVVHLSDMHMDKVRDWEKAVVANRTDIVTKLAAQGVALERPATFRLAFRDDGQPYAITPTADSRRIEIDIKDRPA